MSTTYAIVKQLQGLSFAGKSDSNHWVMMDGPQGFGGSDAGVRPKELVLLALGGCMGSDVVSILMKKQKALEGLEIRLTAEQSEKHPQVFTSIHIELVFHGVEVRPADVERAIKLAKAKYCTVCAMLRSAVRISHAYRIESARRRPETPRDRSLLHHAETLPRSRGPQSRTATHIRRAPPKRSRRRRYGTTRTGSPSSPSIMSEYLREP
jgi:putative redox protein